jgi:hypothetical protein
MDFVCQSFPESGGKYIASVTGLLSSTGEELRSVLQAAVKASNNSKDVIFSFIEWSFDDSFKM